MWQNRKSKPTTKSSRSKKIARLDVVFSKYIRRRDCGFTYGRCISCGAVITFETCDAGHYINRQHMATRYDENNVHAQCRPCNRFDEGKIQGYRKGLIRKIGEKATEMLEIKKHNVCHLSEAELEILLKHFNSKLLLIS